MRYLWLPVLVLAVLAAPAVARADFAAGQKAYEAGDFRIAMQEWLPLAEAGDAEAAFKFGLLYRDGLGVEVDPEAAKRWLLAAGESKDTSLVREAGKAIDKLNDYKGARLYAVKLLKEAAADGDAEATYIIGEAFLFGKKYKKFNFGSIYPANPAIGVKLLRIARDKGYAPAVPTLAFAYFNGLGVEKDEAKAIELVTGCAEMGDSDCQSSLSSYYYTAAKPLKDYLKSVTWAMTVYYSLPEGSPLGDSALVQALSPGSHLTDAEIETAKAKAKAWIKEHRRR